MNPGIESIGSYLPADRLVTAPLAEPLGISPAFAESKLGFQQLARQAADETVESMCMRAVEDLPEDCSRQFDIVIVVTQHPTCTVPHVSAKLHGLLSLSPSCLTFDVSLGCSGWVAALEIVDGLLAQAGDRRALICTCDPYSRIVDPGDRNTAMIFGDAATATVVSPEGRYQFRGFISGTDGTHSEALNTTSGRLVMNGRRIMNFVSEHVPASFESLCQSNSIQVSDIGFFAVHQGSRYIVESIQRIMEIDPARMPFSAESFGNTVSSSIPLMLKDPIQQSSSEYIAVSGFGVGLCYSTGLLQKAGD